MDGEPPRQRALRREKEHSAPKLSIDERMRIRNTELIEGSAHMLADTQSSLNADVDLSEEEIQKLHSDISIFLTEMYEQDPSTFRFRYFSIESQLIVTPFERWGECIPSVPEDDEEWRTQAERFISQLRGGFEYLGEHVRDTPCPKCHQYTLYVQTIQLRSADESSDDLYTCKNCRFFAKNPQFLNK